MAAGPGSKKRSSTASTAPAPESSSAASTPAADPQPAPSPAKPAAPANYTVVARRYRPQRFEDVVGQDHVVQALRNAIRLNRLAQAYLFCGTRGVGKTSMARIFAKCLNCVRGPTETPCQVCDICQAIAAGQDVDVIEIDGASNNGVEQVRELRQNAALRPSRSRYKIYYIDEVHMLSTGAFNALLKTLEEPPPHVKFFFATTEANKIPITVLSRCQRFDFAGITSEAIVNSLKEICTSEQVDAEPEALRVVARRAGGSMRDAQSLLELLLASGSPRLTVEVVHTLLGTPSDERLLAILEALADRDPAAVLTLLDQGAGEGVQPSDLLAGALEFLRDAMVLSVGAEPVLLAVTPRQKPRLQSIVDRWSIDAILAALQILAEARSRMRGVSHARLLAELALVRVARLENLSDLSNMVQRLTAIESGSPVSHKTEAHGTKKKLTSLDPQSTEAVAAAEPPRVLGGAPARSGTREQAVDPAPAIADLAEGTRVEAAIKPSPAMESSVESRVVTSSSAQAGSPAKAIPASRPPAEGVPAAHEAGPGTELPALELAAIRQVWPELVKKVGSPLSMRLAVAEAVSVEDSDVLVIAAKPGYNSLADSCGTDEAREKIAHCLQRLLRRPVTVRYHRSLEPAQGSAHEPFSEPRRPEILAADPMVQKVVELFEARPLHLEYDDDPDSP
ncbi:MAG: DNA polymerase III subunit gamma/tau [Isosphaeraceae bacterium]